MYTNILVSLLLLTYSASTTDSQFFQNILDIAVLGDHICIADDDTLHLFHSNLTRISSLAVGTSAVSKITFNNDGSFIIVCLVDGLCKTYKTENLFETNSSFVQASVVAGAPTARIALGATSNSTFYTGSEGYSMRTGRKSIMLKQFKYDWSATYQLRTSEAFIIRNSNFLSRDFYNVFNSKHFTYYVAVDTIGDMKKLTVMRVCDDVQDGHFRAVTEVELDCGLTVSSFNITYTSLLSTVDHKKILVIATSSRNCSRVCAYHLEDIDKELKRIYHECVSSDHKIPLAWASFDYMEDCSRLTEVYVHIYYVLPLSCTTHNFVCNRKQMNAIL